MIEALGASPISTAVSAGLNTFVSILRSKPSRAFGDLSKSRPYTKTRGIIIEKSVLSQKPLDLNKGYQFQFNPATIEDVKETLYESRTYAGLPYQDYVWSGGGARTINFELFLDDTPASHTHQFRPTEYGSTLADEFKTDGYNYDETGRLIRESSSYIGKDFVENMVSEYRTLKSSVENIKPAKKPTDFTWVTNGAYSKTRIHERGILDTTELLQSFLYPARLDGESVPKFVEGGVVSFNQFRPPATLVLCIGPLYLEGVLKSLPINYVLFDTDLTPIRATANVEFLVFDYANVTKLIDYKR